MTSKELRSGNLVYLTKDNWQTQKIYELNEFDIYKLSESDCIDSKPIPLTEEWLLKFGYKNTKFNIWQGKFHKISQFNEEMFCCDRNGNTLKYVHQLQNLYFALTGEELEIK